MTEPKLKVWHNPQVGNSPSFEYEVSNPIEAWLLLDVLAKYDQFQLDNKIKPDYANAQGLVKLNENDLLWEDYDAVEELDAEEEDIRLIELEELKELYENKNSDCLRPKHIKEMLEYFREQYGLTDQEMIKEAESSSWAPSCYKTWLLLLNRKDLADKL